jgi:GTP-binding protein
MRHAWAGMIETYLREREPLAMVLVLVDAEIGPTKLDAQMLDWLRAEALPHTIVATKLDKVKSSQRPKRRKELADGCQLEPADIVWTSAAKGVGLDDLRSLVLLWLTT